MAKRVSPMPGVDNREAMLTVLTGVDASKLNYYPELKSKIRELEVSNEELRLAKQAADEWYHEVCRNAEELALLYRRSKAQAERLDRAIVALQSISQMLTNTTRGVDVLLQSIVDTAAQLFEAEYAVVTYGEGADAKRVVYCTHGLPSGPAPAIPPQSLLNLLDAAARERRPVIDVYSVSGKPVTVLCTSMFREASLVGSICLQSRDGYEFTDSDISILQTLANQAATAIEDARLFEESQHLQQVTRRLYEMAIQQKEEAERKTRELKQAKDELSEMQKEQILGEERNRIARELHDNVAQILMSIGLNLEWCRHQLPEGSPVLERLQSVKQLARNGIHEIRHAIFELSSVSVPSPGLEAALQDLMQEFQNTTGIETGFSVAGTAQRLPVPAETALFRIAQEALSNVFKHAQATRVDLLVSFQPGGASLQITDNGIGIAKTTVERSQEGLTFGLRNMQSRMRGIGGSLEVASASTGGRGTRITAYLPVEEA